MHDDLLPAGLARRLAAILYDALLVFGILFVLSIPILIAVEKLSGAQLHDHPLYPAYIGLMYVVAFVYFGWFWTKTGQTLGMKAWRVRITDRNAGNITWFQAAMRFIGALISWIPLGAGFLWSLTNRDKTSWHDTLSGSQLVLTPKQKLFGGK